MDGSGRNLQISDCTLQQFLGIAARYGTRTYGYAVTPNTDHLLRFSADPSFRELYRRAQFVLMDSRFLSLLLRVTTGRKLPICAGSDLTAALLHSVVQSDDPLVLIGGSAGQADYLRRRFGLADLQHYEPPMGFIDDPDAVAACLDFIEKSSPFRFCFLAVGCPQQERLASLLKTRGRARGLALCVGGAINFITGNERRAPGWMQQAGLEWLHRLLIDPRRMAARYLVRGPRIFLLLPRIRWALRAEVESR